MEQGGAGGGRSVMESGIQAVIFDIDGTLVDSVDYHAEAWQRAFARFGKELPFKRVREQIGKGGDQLMPVFLSAEEIASFGDRLEQYRGELYKHEYLPRVRAFPKVRELFLRILADGKQVALASSAPQDELRAYKKIAGIEDLLDAESSADDSERSKPHPDIFNAALRELGGPLPSTVLVVGDTPYDAQAANKAGLRTIGVRSGGFSEESLRQAGCIVLYDDPQDLLEGYGESPIVDPHAARFGLGLI